MKLSPSVRLSPACLCAHSSTRVCMFAGFQSASSRRGGAADREVLTTSLFSKHAAQWAVLTRRRDGEESKFTCSFNVETDMASTGQNQIYKPMFSEVGPYFNSSCLLSRYQRSVCFYQKSPGWRLRGASYSAIHSENNIKWQHVLHHEIIFIRIM